MGALKLSLLIPSLASRQQQRTRLLRLLREQWVPGPELEILVDVDAGEASIGEKRARLLRAARGDYVASIDDDDLVADDYLPRVMRAIDEGKDCCTLDGVFYGNLAPLERKPFHHCLSYREWWDDKEGFYRCPNHLNAVKRELALKASFPALSMAEDKAYSLALRPLLATEAVIEGPPLYYYFAKPPAKERSRSMRLLFKYPSRGRIKMFEETVRSYLKALSGNHPCTFLISTDSDDVPMRDEAGQVLERLWQEHAADRPFEFRWFNRAEERGKIAAINAHVGRAGPWDVLVAIADDMVPVKQDFDEDIVADVARLCPDLDGLLVYDDGRQSGSSTVATLPVMGRSYYDRFGYIYHPSYKSLWCDNELSEVAGKLGLAYRVKKLLIKHDWIGGRPERDEIHVKNESFWHSDRENFEARQLRDFDL